MKLIILVLALIMYPIVCQAVQGIPVEESKEQQEPLTADEKCYNKCHAISIATGYLFKEGLCYCTSSGENGDDYQDRPSQLQYYVDSLKEDSDDEPKHKPSKTYTLDGIATDSTDSDKEEKKNEP